MFQQQHGMVRQVADIAKLFIARVDHENRVADGMTGRGQRRDTRNNLLIVLVEDGPDLDRHEILLCLRSTNGVVAPGTTASSNQRCCRTPAPCWRQRSPLACCAGGPARTTA